MENKVVFYKNSNIHQVETKALPKISPNSYKFIFITFKGTQKIPDEEEIKKRQSVFNKSVKCDPIGKCVIEIGVKTDQNKEDETYIKENNNGQSFSKNGSFKEKKVTHYELLEDLKANKEKSPEKSKSPISSVHCEKNSLSVKCKSDEQSKNKFHKHSAKDTECTFQQNEDNKEDMMDKNKKQPKKTCQLTSTILKLKDRVMNNPLFAEEDREFQKVSEDDGNECENVKKPDVERTEEPSKESLDDSKNDNLNEHTTETNGKKENHTSSLYEDEGRFERSNEDNREYTLNNSKEVLKENNQLNLTILKLKDRITQTKNLLPHEEDTSEFQEQNEANNLFQKSEDTFASDLGELSIVKSREPHDLENLDAIEKKETEENYSLSSKFVQKEKNESVITKKLLNEEEVNEKSNEHNENNGKNKFPSESKLNVDVTEAPRIKTVKSHDCVKNLAETLKCISEKNCLVSPLFENRNKAKEIEIKKNILSEVERKSKLQEENEDNLEDISEEEYKRTYKSCTELQRTNEDDPEKDYLVSFTEDIPVAEEISSSELQEQNAADNLFPKNEDKFDSDLVELPNRIRCKQPHDSQQLDVIEDNETAEDYALPSKMLKENKNATVDTNKLLSEEETNDKERNENIETKLNVHVKEIRRIKTVESHDCVKNLAVTQKCISEKICTLSSLPEDRNKSKETEFKKILLSEEERKSRTLQEESEDNSENISEKDHERTDENCTGLSRINENDRKEDCVSSIDLKTSKLHETIIKDTSENMKQIEDKEELRNSNDSFEKMELDEDRVEDHRARQRNSTQICNPSLMFEPNNGFVTKNEIFSKNTAAEENDIAINEPGIQCKKEILEVLITKKSKKRSKSYDCIQEQKNRKKKKIELVERNKTSLDKGNTFLDKSETLNNSENLNVSEKIDTSQNMGLFEQDNDEQMMFENIDQNNEIIDQNNSFQTSKEFLCTGNKNEEFIKLAESERKKLSVTHENLEDFNENSHPKSQLYKTNENEDDDNESIKINKNKVTMRSKKARKVPSEFLENSSIQTETNENEDDDSKSIKINKNKVTMRSKKAIRKVTSEFLENSIQTEHPYQLQETKVLKKINVISNELLNPLKKQIEEKAIKEAEDEEGNVNLVKETRSEKRKEKTRLTQKRIRDYFAKERRKSENKQDLTIEEIEKDRSVSSHYSFQSLESTSEDSQNQSINEQKSDDCLREKLIHKITHAIDKVIHENEHLGVSHQVNVNVDVKKVDSIESTEEEVVVSYKKCLNKSSNEMCNVRKENKKVEDDSIPGSSFEQTPTRVEEKEGSDYANETCFDDNEEEEKDKEQRLEDEEPITKMIKKLDGLRIIIHWSLPPLHQTKVITGVLTNEQKQELTDQGVKIKTGKFTTLEDETIKSNWTEFCKEHDLPLEPSPFLNFSHLKGINFPWEERLNFVRFIAHGLSNRTLQSVYRRFQKLKTKMKTGRFTEKEDEIIMKYMKNSANDKHYAHLATILNRDRTAVYKRHKILMTEDKVKKIKWNEKQITEFMKHLFKVSNCNCTEDLKGRDITSEEWNKLSQKLNIPNQQLRRVWFSKIYPRLFIENKVNTNEVKKKLIKILLDREEDDWKNVKWDEIAEDFPGLTGQYLYFMFKATVRYHVPKQHHMSLKECLKHLKIRYSEWPKVNKEVSKLDLDESYLVTDAESDSSI